MIVARPSFGNIDAGALLVFLCAVMVSVQLILNRKLGSASRPLATSLWGAVIAALALSLPLPMSWQTPDLGEIGLLALIAAISALSQLMILVAYVHAPVSKISPFTYFELVSAIGGWPCPLRDCP